MSPDTRTALIAAAVVTLTVALVGTVPETGGTVAEEHGDGTNLTDAGRVVITSPVGGSDHEVNTSVRFAASVERDEGEEEGEYEEEERDDGEDGEYEGEENEEREETDRNEETDEREGTEDEDETEIRSLQWDFNGDGFVDATGTDVSHTYGSTGTYTVTVAAVTDDGVASADSVAVNVSSTATPEGEPTVQGRLTSAVIARPRPVEQSG